MRPLIRSSTTPTLGRVLAIWLGSFLLIATVLMSCFQIPLGPLLLAGGLTFAVAVIRFLIEHQKR